MKKILFITGDQSLTGGTERACANVANMLSDEGFLVEIISFNNEKNTSHFKLNESVVLSSLNVSGLKGIYLFFKAQVLIKNYIIENDFDYVVVVESLIFIFMIPSVIFCKVKIINWEHFNYDVDLGLKTRRIARWLASKYADINIVLTQADKDKWIKYLKANPQNIFQIYNLNPFDDIEVNSNKLANKSNVVLAAGRLTTQKGFDLLIQAWSRVSVDIRLDWSLIIVGEGEDRKKLESMVSALKLDSSISLPGISTEMIKMYQNCEVFVLSSRYEGFGLVLTEALSCNSPVIAFDCPDGPAEIIYHNENGLLVKKEDVDSLAQALELYMNDEGLRQHLQSNVFKGLERFTKKEILPKWLSIFQ